MHGMGLHGVGEHRVGVRNVGLAACENQYFSFYYISLNRFMQVKQWQLNKS
jgi:hypothetical protein